MFLGRTAEADNSGSWLSEIELQGELNQPRVIARRGDAAEIAGVNNLSGVLINGGGVEVADGVIEVDVIEQVEELGAELDVL